MAYSLIIRKNATLDQIEFIDGVDDNARVVSRLDRAGLSREARREVNHLAVNWWKKKNNA